ncbi:MAG TPA: iron-containing redox enzyme family protein [Acidimicrobiales bacterium]|nr:iron-containing redox enzyme family protein [Acidimicrobiales bacterium]
MSNRDRPPGGLRQRLAEALARGGSPLESLRGAEPADERDGLLALLGIYDLSLGPAVGGAGFGRWQGHPVVATVKWRLEAELLETLEKLDRARRWALPDDPVAALRALAAADKVPAIYRWLAERADYREIVEFLALEGGPDGGFDDLVAICQVGLRGEAKLELARNYWDEMGRGEGQAVHTELYRRLARAVDLRPVPREDQPVEALRRAALGPFLVVNRWLQPEALGALGLIEMQAGPRCRQVVTALRRTGAPADAIPFYAEHATADPRHGKQWLDNAVGTLGRADPAIGVGMVRGARWRWAVNAAFLTAVGRLVGAPDCSCPAAALQAAG